MSEEKKSENPRHRLLRFAAKRSDDVVLTSHSNALRSKEVQDKPVYHWRNTNSHLEQGHAFTTFQDTFGRVVPKGHSLRSYIEFVIGEGLPGKAIGLEVGGVGSELFKSFSEGFLAASLAVSLTDYRTSEQKEDDATRHHECLTGDLSSPETYEKIESWLREKKFDFIFERMLGGLTFMPKEPLFLMSAFDALYGMLKENGAMFMQIPDSLVPYVQTWKQNILKQYPEVLEIQIAEGSASGTVGLEPVIRLVKKKGAPAHLPVLHA